ncbi:MAG: UbiA family prenyltransferase [Planctomycetes bacterium]|nr:UbiA family prenyltransferase [Planctomycetota bacterium]
MSTLRDWLALVRFSHSVFALPFALCGAWLAAGGPPGWRVAVLVVLCAVAARTAAMGFNRLVDRASDAANPRTRGREIPSGKLGPGAVRALVVFASLAFVALAFALNPLAGWLSAPVLLVLLGYSYVKRVSSSAHLVLGLALSLAPLGAWVAVRGTLEPDVTPVLWLALGVLTWVAGFDLIYACQDAAFDRASGLHSIPARFGLARALQLSGALHVVTVAALAAVGVTAELGLAWWVALGVAALLLVWQHRIVAPHDLSRVDLAFFTLNGWVGVGLFAGLALDRALAGGGA